MGLSHADRRSTEDVDDDFAPSGLPQKDLMFVTSAKYEAEKRMPDSWRQYGLYYGDHYLHYCKQCVNQTLLLVYQRN